MNNIVAVVVARMVSAAVCCGDKFKTCCVCLPHTPISTQLSQPFNKSQHTATKIVVHVVIFQLLHNWRQPTSRTHRIYSRTMPHVPQLQSILQFFTPRHMKKFHKNIDSQWQIVARSWIRVLDGCEYRVVDIGCLLMCGFVFEACHTHTHTAILGEHVSWLAIVAQFEKTVFNCWVFAENDAGVSLINRVVRRNCKIDKKNKK